MHDKAALLNLWISKGGICSESTISLLSVYYQQSGIANDPGGICLQTFGVDESVSSGLSNAHTHGLIRNRLAVLQAL